MRKMLMLVGALGLLLSCVFVLGGIVTCSLGDGQLNGLKCIGFEKIEACRHEGDLYRMPEQNNTQLFSGVEVKLGPEQDAPNGSFNLTDEYGRKYCNQTAFLDQLNAGDRE